MGATASTTSFRGCPAIRQTAGRKATGLDEVLAELIKAGSKRKDSTGHNAIMCGDLRNW